MNREYILENNLIGRYVVGELSAAESEKFEWAFFQDDELAALVEAEQALQSEFRNKEKSPAEEDVSSGSSAWTRWALVATIAGAFAILPLFYFISQNAEPYKLAANPPDASTPFYELEAERGSVPSTAVAIPANPDQRITVAIPVAGSGSDPLTLTLSHENGDVAWTETWILGAPSDDRLFLSVPSSELIPGIYELVVERSVDGRVASSGVYRFRTYLEDLD